MTAVEVCDLGRRVDDTFMAPGICRGGILHHSRRGW